MMIELNAEKEINGMHERFNDMLDKMGVSYKYKLYAVTTPNAYSGNPETVAHFENVVINGIPYKDKRIVWQRASQSEISFINEVKAYLFEVLDGVANM